MWLQNPGERAVRLLSEADVIGLLNLGDVVEAVERGLHELARGAIVSGESMGFNLSPTGDIVAKMAYWPDEHLIVTKLAPYIPENAPRGIPSIMSTLIVLSAETGALRAVIAANAVTRLRTGAAGALAARFLARADAQVAAIIGTGVQARVQAEALCQERSIQEIRVWGRSPERTRTCAAELSERLGLPVLASPSAESAVRGADVVVTCTSSYEPFFHAEWLAHV